MMPRIRADKGKSSGKKGSRSSDMLQLSSNPAPHTLFHLRKGDEAILEHLDLPEDDARRLMELGFLPGSKVTAGQSAPGGDPQVFQVDGSEVALRRTTAAKLHIRKGSHNKDKKRTM